MNLDRPVKALRQIGERSSYFRKEGSTRAFFELTPEQDSEHEARIQAHCLRVEREEAAIAARLEVARRKPA